MLPYFRDGSISPRAPETSVRSHKIVRHPDVISKLKHASTIRVLYYDLEMQNIKQELRFSGNGDSETWFALEQFQYSSSWDIDPSIPNQHVRSEFGNNYLSFTLIKELSIGCPLGNGWSYIIESSVSFSCPAYNWEANSGIMSYNMELHPPLILYADSKDSITFEQFKLGGKISFEVME